MGKLLFEKNKGRIFQGLCSTESNYISCPEAPHVKIICPLNPFILFGVDYFSWACSLAVPRTWWQLSQCYTCGLFLLNFLLFPLCFLSFLSYSYVYIYPPNPDNPPSEMTGASIPDITAETVQKHFQWFCFFIFWLSTGLELSPFEKRETLDLSYLMDKMLSLFSFVSSLWQLILCLTFFLTHLSYAFLFCQKKEKFDISTKWYLYCCNWTERNKILDWWISEGI